MSAIVIVSGLGTILKAHSRKPLNFWPFGRERCFDRQRLNAKGKNIHDLRDPGKIFCIKSLENPLICVIEYLQVVKVIPMFGFQEE